MKTFYVGNLEWSTTVEELEEFFSSYGIVVKAEIKKDFSTGKSRGYGFITMENAEKAMREASGKNFKGRPLKINDARKRNFNELRSKAAFYKEPPSKPRRYENSPKEKRAVGVIRDLKRRYPQEEFIPITSEDVCY